MTDPQDRETPDSGQPMLREPSTDDQDRAPASGAIAVHEETSDEALPEGAPTDDAPTDDAPTAALDPAEDEAVAPAPPAPPRRLLGNAKIAWLVAGLAVLALIGLAILAIPALRAESERAEVRDRAEVVAARVTTFEGANIEEWVAETRALATGAYARQLDDVFDLQLREALRENEVESVGQIQRSFVQLIDGDRAEVFVLARQSSVNAQRAQPVEDELRIEIELRRENGEWLASDIAVLGPQQPGGPVPPPTPAEGDE